MTFGAPSDRNVARAAMRHGGHVTRAELLALGLGRGAINDRVRRGLLIPVYQGVYAVGHLPTNPIDRAHGALLACGPEAALSHSSAAVLWQITNRWPDPLEVTVPTRHRPPGLIVHRSTKLLPVDVIRVQGLRATSRARTLLDQTPRLTDAQLLRAINGQRVNFRLRLGAVHDVLERFPRHPGARRLKAIVATAPDEPYRSEWEIEWPPYAAAHHLPEYDMNVPLAPGAIADVVFRPRLVIVELDGFGTHGLRPAFRRDRRRDRHLYAKLGIPTFRLTREDMVEHPAQEAALLLEIIERRRRELGLADPA
jgi:hypothetical protein